MYDEIKVRGASIVELPRNVELGRFNVSTKRTFKGVKEEIISMASELEDQGYTVNIVEGPNFLLEVTIPNIVPEVTNIPDTTSDKPAQYEYTINNATKDILESNHPIVVGGNGPDGIEYMPLEASHVNALKNWLKTGNTDDQPAFDFYLGRGHTLTILTPVLEVYLLAQLLQAQKLYYLLASGVRTIDVRLHIIRESFQLPYGFEGITQMTAQDGRVFSHDLFVDFERFPTWLHNILTDTPDFSAELPAPNANASSLVKRNYGWLKKVVSSGETTEGRIVLVNEYHWGLWSETIQGTVIQ